jgi:negative regulator of sigma E activity
MNPNELKKELEKFAQIADLLAKDADASIHYNREELSEAYNYKLVGQAMAYKRMADILRTTPIKQKDSWGFRARLWVLNKIAALYLKICEPEKYKKLKDWDGKK